MSAASKPTSGITVRETVFDSFCESMESSSLQEIKNVVKINGAKNKILYITIILFELKINYRTLQEI